MNRKHFTLSISGAAFAALCIAAADPSWISYTKAQAERGRIAYVEHCANCHGATLGGGAAPTLTGAFWSSWNGRTLGEMFTLTRNSMPADAPASLSDQDYADILAYMLQKGGYPSGTAALPASAASLASRKIERQR